MQKSVTAITSVVANGHRIPIAMIQRCGGQLLSLSLLVRVVARVQAPYLNHINCTNLKPLHLATFKWTWSTTPQSTTTGGLSSDPARSPER